MGLSRRGSGLRLKVGALPDFSFPNQSQPFSCLHPINSVHPGSAALSSVL